MFKGVLIGLWGCLIAAGSSYGVSYWQTRKPAEAHAAVPADKMERRKSPPMTVPVVVEGKIQGYLLAQLALLGPGSALKAESIAPEVLMGNEAFQVLYSDDRFDFRHLEKYDLKAFTDEVLRRIQKRVGKDTVTEVMVDDFNYVSKDDLRK